MRSADNKVFIWIRYTLIVQVQFIIVKKGYKITHLFRPVPKKISRVIIVVSKVISKRERDVRGHRSISKKERV